MTTKRMNLETANAIADRMIGEGVRSGDFHNVARTSEVINRLRASAKVENKAKGDRLWKMLDNHIRFCDGKHYHEGSCDHGGEYGSLIVPLGGIMHYLTMCVECGEIFGYNGERI